MARKITKVLIELHLRFMQHSLKQIIQNCSVNHSAPASALFDTLDAFPKSCRNNNYRAVPPTIRQNQCFQVEQLYEQFCTSAYEMELHIYSILINTIAQTRDCSRLQHCNTNAFASTISKIITLSPFSAFRDRFACTIL